MASTRGARGVALVVARRGPEGRARERTLHHDADSDLRDFFYGDGEDCGAKRVARSLPWLGTLPHHLSVEIARGDECLNCIDEGTM